MKKKIKLKPKIKFFQSLRWKVVVSIIIFSILFFAIIVFFTGYINYRFATMAIARRNHNLARTVALTVDEEYSNRLFEEVSEIYRSIPEEIRNNPSDPAYNSYFAKVYTDEYYKLKDDLTRIVKENEISWINFHIEVDDPEKLCFVIDTDTTEDGRYGAGWQSLASNYSGIHDLFFENIDYRIIQDMDYGDTIILRAPYYRQGTDTIIGYVGVGEKRHNAEVNNLAFMVVYMALLFGLTIIIVVISLSGMRKLVIDPIISLSDAAEHFTDVQTEKEERTPVFENLNIHSNDEIGLLASSMASMEEDIYSYMDNLEDVTREQERIATELDVASKIQTSLLPKSLTGYRENPDFEVSALSRSAKEMSGDFYDFFVIDDDHIGLGVADVSDKGIPAAIFMVIASILIKSNSRRNLSPAMVLKETNHMLFERNDATMFVTVFFGIYTVSERKLTYVNAGHEYPGLYRKKEGCYTLIKEDHDLVLGVMDDIELTEREIAMEPGDRLLLYTDGIPEAINKDGSSYGEEALLQCLNTHCELKGSDIPELIRDDIDNFAHGVPQYDDMTILLFEVKDRD